MIRRLRLWVILTALLLVSALAALSGEVAIDWSRALSAPQGSVDGVILWQLRVPRALLALLVGAALGLSGAALQGLLRNPLAEPALLGVSSSAALGAVLAFYFLAGAQGAWLMPLGALTGAGAAVLLILLLAGRQHGALTLILAGVAINALGSALLALALNFAPNPFAVTEILYWLMGSVANASWSQVGLAAPLVAAGAGLMLACGRYLDALSLGEESARSLGFDGARWRWAIIAGAALAVGATVAVAGSIGFVGLVVPHLLRGRVGHRPGALLLPSALGGAVLVLAADTVVRSLSPLGELKLGVVTALVGAPFFLHLLYRTRLGAA